MGLDDLQLHTKIVGALPAINHLIRRLHLKEILASSLPAGNDPDTAQCIGILIKNILV